MGLNKSITRTDKSGSPFNIGQCDAGDYSCLLDMYRIFSPKPASQGLPPVDPDVCCRWVKKLLEIGISFIARKNGRVIGHAEFIPDPDGKSGEFIIFVDRDFRNLGIGSELMRLTIEETGKLSYGSIWLTVENSNLIAIRLYRKFGFQFCDTDIYERTMLLKL